jgi:hypothetical protein
MLRNRDRSDILRPALIVAMLSAPAIMLSPSLPVAAGPHSATIGDVQIDSAVAPEKLQDGVQRAAATFIRAMASGDAAAVWMFATEEEHDAFGTEAAAYDAFAEAFPVLTTVERATFERAWREGDAPFVELTLEDDAGTRHRATMGFWRDDASDWKLISCDVNALSDRVAGL